MNKPLLALTGIALLGTAGVAGSLYVAPLGGEEEVASQPEGTTAPTPTQDLPDGWVRFSHPGTAEAPPFSFAYPGEWHVKGPALVPVTLPKGEPLGTAVLVELFSWDPGTAPSYPGITPALPANAMYMKVFVGPYAPLAVCGPGNPVIRLSSAGLMPDEWCLPGRRRRPAIQLSSSRSRLKTAMRSTLAFRSMANGRTSSTASSPASD